MSDSIATVAIFVLHRTTRFLARPRPLMRSRAHTRVGVATRLATALCLLLSGASAQAVPSSASYLIRTVPLGGNAFGDVVTVGDYVFAGVGSFGSNQIVRIAPGGATTTIATGFKSLSGFAYDAVNDRLIIGDNFDSSTDTVYGLTNPVGFAGPPALASTLELLPAGSIPGIADLAMDPNDSTGMTLFITDATEAFPPLHGAVLEVVLGTSLSTIFEVGTGWFAGGVAASSSTLFVGSSIFGTGGRIHTTSLPLPGGAPTVDFLVDTPNFLPGQFDLELEADGNLLSTSVDQLVRIDPSNGNQSVVASGFSFATGLAVDDDGSIFVVDGISLYKLTAVPEPATGLLVSLGLIGIAGVTRRSRPKN